jgi:ribosomal protein S18 acetylase RimI-like enzyme
MTLQDVLQATWPAAALHRAGPWLIREGQGGGKRVSAATAEGPVTAADIGQMEAAQAALGQTPLVMIRAGEAALDALLAAKGYRVVDPVVVYVAPVAALTGELPPLAAFTIWPPLAIQREIWAEGHIGPGRLAVMDRVAGPKTSLFARVSDKPAGAGFVAIHGDTAMAHAVEVAPALRRQGAGLHMLRAAANWAQAEGATTISLVVTEANAGARALYASLGMVVVEHYHYRMT